MITESQIRTLTQGLFSKIQFTEEPKGLYDPLRYMISLGGKQLRPRLCLTAYALFKDEFDESILQPAAALEVFHNFTLIHDDIMDKSPLRRGKPTVWTKWGEDGAILSGDVMCIDSYRRIAMAPAAVLPQVGEPQVRQGADIGRAGFFHIHGFSPVWRYALVMLWPWGVSFTR